MDFRDVLLAAVKTEQIVHMKKSFSERTFFWGIAWITT